MDRRKFLAGTAGAGVGVAGLAVSGMAQAACASGTDAQMIVLQDLKATPTLQLTYPSGAPADAGYPTVVDETIPPGQLGRYSTV